MLRLRLFHSYPWSGRSKRTGSIERSFQESVAAEVIPITPPGGSRSQSISSGAATSCTAPQWSAATSARRHAFDANRSPATMIASLCLRKVADCDLTIGRGVANVPARTRSTRLGSVAEAPRRSPWRHRPNRSSERHRPSLPCPSGSRPSAISTFFTTQAFTDETWPRVPRSPGDPGGQSGRSGVRCADGARPRDGPWPPRGKPHHRR